MQVVRTITEQSNHRHELLQHLASPSLMRWGWELGMSQREPVSGVAVVQASIACLDEALSLLGDRNGDRADAARTWLTATRERCSSALGALLELTNEHAGFPGHGFDSLLVQYQQRLAGVANAEAALAHSTTKNVRECRDALDHAQAYLRELLQGDIAELTARIAWPNPPAAASFDVARGDTASLHQAARDTAKPATLLALALAQGKAAHAETALLHVAYERPAPKGVLAQAYELRAAMHAESGGAGAMKAATPHDVTTPQAVEREPRTEQPTEPGVYALYEFPNQAPSEPGRVRPSEFHKARGA